MSMYHAAIDFHREGRKGMRGTHSVTMCAHKMSSRPRNSDTEMYLSLHIFSYKTTPESILCMPLEKRVSRRGTENNPSNNQQIICTNISAVP